MGRPGVDPARGGAPHQVPGSLPNLAEAAQKGWYFMSLGAASGSYGMILPASTASRMRREADALLCGSILNLSLSEVFVSGCLLTYRSTACQ